MKHIEKLFCNHTASNEYKKFAFSDCMKSASLVDIFYDEPYLGPIVKENLEKNGISLGGKFGKVGIKIDELHKHNLEDTYIEVCTNAFKCLNTADRINLLENYNVIVYDWIDGGWEVEKMVAPSYYKGAKNLIFGSGALSSLDHLGGKTLNVPVFPMITYSETMRTGNMPDKSCLNIKNKKIAISSNHKPRLNRLLFLASLHKKDLLKDVDWSLTVNFDEPGEYNDYFKSPNVSGQRFESNLVDTEDIRIFIDAYRNEIPKLLPESSITLFSDCIPFNKRYAGKYHWSIACETYTDILFPTEKTFKSMLAGLPVLTVGGVGLNEHIKAMGFEMPYSDLYDNLTADHLRVEKVIDIMCNYKADNESIEYNFNLMSDANYLANLAVQPIIKFFT